jgi:hypothetical protein
MIWCRRQGVMWGCRVRSGSMMMMMMMMIIIIIIINEDKDIK